MRIRSLVIPLVFLTAFCSCGNKTQVNANVIPFVEAVLADHECRDFKLLSSSAKADPQDELFIIGSHSEAWGLAHMLCESDKFDNITGSEQPDYLPDFAGEYFSLIADSLGNDLRSYVNSGRTDSLRKLFTEYCLSALDTVSHLSVYDEKGLGIKRKAKVIIIADPLLSSFCKYDADTLFAASGCRIQLVSPIDFTLRDVCSSSQNLRNIAVICSSENADSRMYQKILDRYAAPGAEITALSVSRKKDGALQEFLSIYADTTGRKTLDALIVDDRTVSLDSLSKDLGEIRSLMFEDSMIYGDLIGDNFFIASTDDICAKELYRIMRADDLFTHDIRLPRIVEYITVGVKDSVKPYMLISTNVQN